MRRKSLSASYAFFWGIGVLAVFSVLCLSVMAYSRSMEQFIEVKEKIFCSELHEKNEAVLSEWRNEHADD